MVKFLFFLVIIYFLIRSFTRWFANWGRRATGNYSQQQEQTTKEPQTQEERILDYQRKTFESTDAQDVEFEEIEHPESGN